MTWELPSYPLSLLWFLPPPSFRDLRTCLSLLLWPLTSEYPCLHSTSINSHPLELGIAHKCCSTSETFSPTPHFRSQASSSHNPDSTHILSFCPLAVTCPFPSRSRVMIYHFPTLLSKPSTPLILSQSNTTTALPPLSSGSTSSVPGHCQKKIPQLAARCHHLPVVSNLGWAHPAPWW